MKFWAWLRDTLRTWIALDYRSLAFLRISIATTILCDLIGRAISLRAHYTDLGVLPRSELFRLWGMDWTLSFHLISGNLWFQILLFIIAGIAALALLFGYRTRLAIVISWLLLISIQTRNPLVLQGGDIVFRTTVFFMMFLPLARAWSLDRLFNRIPAPKEKTVSGPETLAFIVQVCVLYVFTGLLKTGPAWHTEGSAVYYALNVDQLIAPFGVWLRGFPSILPLLTHAVYFFEVFGIILFFIPWKNWVFRTLGVFGFITLQAGFNISMRLGLFGLIASATLLGLLPSEFWDKIISPIATRISRNGIPGLTVIYDFDCSFCHKASFALTQILLLHPETRIISSTEHETGRLVMEQENSWVVIDGTGAIHTGFRGFIAIATHSPYARFLAPVFAFWPIHKIGEWIYRLVAERRMLVCAPEPKEREIAQWKRDIVGLFLIGTTFYVLALNIESLGHQTLIPEKLRPFEKITRLDQRFNMFAPTPLIEDGWYVMPGKLRNGSQVDVFRGIVPVTYKKPKWIAYGYKNQRWQKYLMNLWSSDLSEFRLGYGQYLCRTWNTKYKNTNNELLSFDIVFMLERTPPPGEPLPEPVPTTIWHHECFN